MILIEQTWRLYVSPNPVSLSGIKQAGTTDLVTSLHPIKNEVVWTANRIIKRRNIFEKHVLKWPVTEAFLFTNISKHRT